jgi:hypothetical protein
MSAITTISAYRHYNGGTNRITARKQSQIKTPAPCFHAKPRLAAKRLARINGANEATSMPPLILRIPEFRNSCKTVNSSTSAGFGADELVSREKAAILHLSRMESNTESIWRLLPALLQAFLQIRSISCWKTVV